MTDGTEKSVQVTTDLLPAPTVDADNEKRGIAMSERTQSPQDRLFAAAREIAREQAERTFRNIVDPYSAKLHMHEARGLVQSIYYCTSK